jgi:hypothetical protein
VSGERIASILWVEEYAKEKTSNKHAANRAQTLKVQTISFSETSADFELQGVTIQKFAFFIITLRERQIQQS